jgi:hypothetical protein
MSPEQETHLKTIIKIVSELLDDKYRKGQAEHGGNLFDMSARELIYQNIFEHIDGLTYCITALSKIDDVVEKYQAYPSQEQNKGG